MMNSTRLLAIIGAMVLSPLFVFAQVPELGRPPAATETAQTQPQSDAPSEGTFTVSVTSLAAPDKAKKALEKGVQEERKGKWESARDYFTSAIKMYPRYALAWLALGRFQVRQN